MSFMSFALGEARKAFDKDEVPVGAVIVKDGHIISLAHNLKETHKDPTAHAEVLAIRDACDKLSNWRLSECDMYVTLEPCPMCASAIAQARIRNLHIGTFDPVSGACGSVINIIQNRYLNYNINITWEYDEECSKILESFFKQRR